MEGKKQKVQVYIFSSLVEKIKEKAREHKSMSKYINNLILRDLTKIDDRYHKLLIMMFESPNIHINRGLIISLGNSPWTADCFINYCVERGLIQLVEYEQTNERLRLSKKITNKHKCYGLTLRGVDICKELTKKFK
jgi:hypothetical protein